MNSDVCKPNIYQPRGPGSRLSEPDAQRHMGFLTKRVEQILTKGLCGILHGNSSSCRHEFHTISLRGIYTHTAAISLARNMRSGSEIELQHFIKDWPTFTLIAELTRLWCEIRRLQTKKLLTERPGFKAKWGHILKGIWVTRVQTYLVEQMLFKRFCGILSLRPK